MIYVKKYIWILTILINVLRPVHVQFPMQMFPPQPPPMFPVPAPMPFISPALLPVPVPLPNELRSSTPSTTQKPPAEFLTPSYPHHNERPGMSMPGMPMLGMPMPVMPMPIPIPMPPPILNVPPPFCQRPAPRPTKCPPCPPCVCEPSCTPSFFSFCSPCHQKCRCKRQEDAPEPLPPRPSYAIQIGPPPVVVVPLPPALPHRPIKKPKPMYSSCSGDSSDTSSDEYEDFRSRRTKRHRKNNLYGRSRSSYENENELVKPMLSYVARNGDVKFETKIDGSDVAHLLGENSKRHKTVHVVTRGDEEDKREVVVLTNNENKRHRLKKNKKVYLRDDVTNHMLEDGKKELIFKPSGDKKISNLSLSFQIS